ncbi:MAG: alpha/beta hydrolase [Dehalococcoidia bacterium]|nr:alpha/beta hydrolase [Dehalococcoidia bacterium]
MDVDSLLDPDIREALKSVPQMNGFTFDQVPAMRETRLAQLATIQSQLSDAVERTDYTVPGPDGAPDVALRVHRPAGQQGPLPAIYWMHGGGYVFGSHEMDDLRFDKWCPALNCIGISVEYRLAPETPYPGPLEDAYAGLAWVHENAATLGIDTAHLGIGGASAGGGLAAGLALLTRDRGKIPLAFQLLIYPMIDDRMTSVSSGWEVPIWSPASNKAGWAAYLGDLVGGDVPIYAAAARARELDGLPQALITVGALDGFLDEDIDYALRLTHAGVPTELHVYPGGPHGFDALLPGTALARRARADMETWLAHVLRA